MTPFHFNPELLHKDFDQLSLYELLAAKISWEFWLRPTISKQLAN